MLEKFDGSGRAELWRSYGWIDVNFRVRWKGRTIHVSNDCRSTLTIPFRELLAWDETGRILVFQLAGDTVFAFDTATERKLEPHEFEMLTLPTVTLDDIGFEGLRQLRREMKNEVPIPTDAGE